VQNNCAIEMVIDAVSADAINLHENKVIEVESDKLLPYLDSAGNPFRYFVVTSLYRNAQLELIVRAQAYADVFFDTLCVPPEGGGCEDVVWECLTNCTATGNDIVDDDVGASGDHNAWGQSEQVITAADEYFQWKVPATACSGYVGVTPADCPGMVEGEDYFDYTHVRHGFYYWHTQSRFCRVEDGEILGGCTLGTGTAYTSDTVFALRRNSDGKIEFLVDDVVIYTTPDDAEASLRLLFFPEFDNDPVFFAVNDAQFCTAGAAAETQTESGYVQWITPDDDVTDGPFGPNTRIRAATSNQKADGLTIPSGIDPADIKIARWTHTIAQLPSEGHTYHLLTDGVLDDPRGFRVRWHGNGWIYSNAGVDEDAFPEGTLQVGDTLTFEYDENNGSPVYRYKRNGVTVLTDSTGTNEPLPNLEGLCTTTGDVIGEVFFEVEYAGECAASPFQVSPVGGGGPSVPLSSAFFDPLASETASQPDELGELESGI